MSIRTTERLLNILILIGALALIFVVGYPQYKESLPSKIRIGVDKSFSSLPFYMAQMDTSRDYFRIEKIEPEFIEIEGNALQGLKDGIYDVTAVPWYWLLISPSTNGDTVKAFSSIELRAMRTFDAILVPPGSRIKRLRDLNGRDLGFLASDEYLINLIIEEMAADNVTRVNPVPLQLEDIPTAFADGKVDALYLLDPERGYMIVNEGAEVLLDGLIAQYIMPSMPYAAFVLRKNYAEEENKLAAIRLKNAFEAMISYLARNPEVGKRFIIKMRGWENPDDLTLNIKMPEYQRLTEIDNKNIERMQTELVQRGIGTCGIKPAEFLFQRTDFIR
jgi:ABC-type nitrate/sulfonate/bicarbonate transport system substrate-binding protein